MFKYSFLLLLILSLSGCESCGEPPPTPHKVAMEQIDREKKRAVITAQIVKNPTEKINRDRELVIAVPYLPEHLNPYIKISEWGYRIAMHNIYESLIDRDPATGKLVGALAESWEVEPGGTIFRFKLRPGLRWQDGRPLTVEDVIFSFQLLHVKKIDLGPFYRDIDFSFKRIDKTEDGSVRIILSNPNAYFLDHLVEFPIIPSHVFYRGVSKKTRGSISPIGSGPYRLYQWIPREKIILVKNEYYWGSVPAVERIVFQAINDVSNAFVGIRRRQLGMLPRVSPVHYPAQITENIKKDYALYSFVPPSFNYILWNTTDPKLADFRVRRALSMLVDTKSIIKKVFRGLATPCTGPFWPTSGLGRKEAKGWEFSPDKAKELLYQVGWRDTDGDKILDKGGVPFKIVMLVPVDSHKGRAVADIIRGDYQRAGIEMMIVPTDWTLFRKHLKKKSFTAAMLSWSGRPYEDFSPLFHSTGRYNYGVVYNVLIDKHLALMRRTESFKEMLPLSIKLEEMLESYLPMTFLFRPVELSLIHRRFKNVLPSPEGFRFASWQYDEEFIKTRPTEPVFDQSEVQKDNTAPANKPVSKPRRRNSGMKAK